MKTLAIAVATAMFALTAPVEASAPAPAQIADLKQCAPGFSLFALDRIFPRELYEGYDRNGDGYICWKWLDQAERYIYIDNTI
jgi:hypothetical protein